jgi:signal transduction histidine kinase
VASDRWARALHDLYLITLVIAFVATALSFPAGVTWLVVGGATAVLCVADRVVPQSTAYFLSAGMVVGLLTTPFPTFAAAAFGLLPLAFVQLPRWAAIAVGVIATGSPYLVRWLGWESDVVIRFGPAYFVVVGIALPVLTGLFTAAAVRALNRASRLAGQAEERRRLAHELHDTLAQGLAGVLLQLEAAEQYLDHPDAARLVARARETAGDCLVDTRRAVAALQPAPLDTALLPDAIAELCAGVARCAFHGRVRRCHPSVEVVALRVVQEALANVAKHAAADHVAVTVEYRPTALCLVVRDDGRGFSPGPTSGVGLATMRERVESAGGTLSITSAPGAGTTVTATLEDQ